MSQAPSGAWSAKPSLPPSESVLTGLWERTISGPCRCQVSAPIPRPGRATELDLCEGQRGGQWLAVSGVRGHSGTHGRSTAVSFLRGRGRSHGHTGTHGREARAVQSTPCCRALAPSAPPGSPHRSREQRWTHVLGKRHKRQLLELFTPNQQTNAALSVGARGPVPASEHGGCLPSNARGRVRRERGPAIPGAMVTARGRPPRTVADTQNAASCEQERGRTPLGHVPSPFEGTAFELRPHSTASLSAHQSCSRPSSQVHPVPRHDTEAKGSDRSHGSQPAGLAGPTLPSRPPAHAVPMAGDPAVQGHVCPLPSEAGRPPAGRGHLVCCSTGHDRSRRPL